MEKIEITEIFYLSFLEKPPKNPFISKEDVRSHKNLMADFKSLVLNIR